VGCLQVASILLDWVRSLAHGCGVSPQTLGDDSLVGGVALLAVLNFFDSYECPFRPSDSASDNLERFFEDALRLCVPNHRREFETPHREILYLF